MVQKKNKSQAGGKSPAEVMNYKEIRDYIKKMDNRFQCSVKEAKKVEQIPYSYRNKEILDLAVWDHMFTEENRYKLRFHIGYVLDTITAVYGLEKQLELCKYIKFGVNDMNDKLNNVLERMEERENPKKKCKHEFDLIVTRKFITGQKYDIFKCNKCGKKASSGLY